MKSSALTLAAAAGLLAAVTSPGLAAARVQPAQTGTTAPVCSAGTCTGTFTTPGTGQTFVVPAGVSSMSVILYGGSGGRDYILPGGDGAEVTATLAVSPGATLGVDVGGAGQDGGGVGGAGGVNGGGSSGDGGGGGGGATDVTLSGTSLLVAGGGGGAGQDAYNEDYCLGGPGGVVSSAAGGAGGNADTAGGNALPFIDGSFSVNGGTGGGAGSAVHGGAGGTGGTFTGTDPCLYYELDPGANGDPGTPGNGAAALRAGAGGGGYYGGAGGGEDAYINAPGAYLIGSTGGGGGGSSYTGGAGVSGASVNDTGNPESGLGSNGKAMFSYPDPLATGSPSYAVPAGQILGVPAGNGLLSATAGTSGPTGDALTASGPVSGATQAGGSVDVNPNGSFFYTPPAGYSGADSFTYQVGDAAGDYATGTVTIQVQPLAQTITFTSSPPDPASVGGPSYTPAATGGGSGNPVTFSIDASSTAGACSISSGVVSFGGVGTCVVDADQAGGGGYAPAPEASQAITVDQGPAFLLDSPSAVAATGQVYSYTFAASGAPTPSYAVAPGAPAWVSINASTGTLTAVPPKGTTSFSYQVVATNPAGSVTAGPFTVAVKTFVPKADLSAALSCPATLAVGGGSGTCTLTVTNNGPAAAAGAQAVLLLPSELGVTSCVGCTRHQKAVTWKLGTVQNQATVTLTLTVHALAAGQGTVTATVGSTTTDRKPYNNLATAVVTVQG